MCDFRLALALPPPRGIASLSRETAIAFARAGRAPIETAIAFACAGRAPIETGIAFAGEKWVFFVHFSVAVVSSVSTLAVQGRALVMAVSCWPASAGAEASSVSMLAVQGRALVMVVSCWPASVAAEVSLVSTSPRHSCLCAKKFALLGPVRMRARNSSPCTRKMAHNRRSVACWASFFANIPLDGSRWVNFFAPVVAKVVILTDVSSNRAVL